MLDQAQATALHDPGLTELFRRWDEALAARDRDMLAACYLPDAVVYDVGGTLRGFEALWAQWTACFPYFTKTIRCARSGITVMHGDVTAVVIFRSRLTGMDTEHPAATSWYRTTVVLMRQGDHEGDWKIAHEHVSLGMDCMNERPVYDHDGA
ncbi:MAG: DUF4440 domain-containing protein [Pseudomonadota bacterium]